jgi:hypothetical protein
MLIQKQNLENAVISLKLTNGDEVVAKCLEYTDQTVKVSKPLLLQMQMVSQTQAGIAFAPFMMSASEEAAYVFAASHLVCRPVPARDDIAANYMKMTTGLDIPTQRSGLIT